MCNKGGSRPNFFEGGIAISHILFSIIFLRLIVRFFRIKHMDYPYYFLIISLILLNQETALSNRIYFSNCPRLFKNIYNLIPQKGSEFYRADIKLSSQLQSHLSRRNGCEHEKSFKKLFGLESRLRLAVFNIPLVTW